MKRTAGRGAKRRTSRSGAAWPRGKAPSLDSIGQQALALVVEMRSELGREPTAAEIVERLGVRDAKAILSAVGGVALPFRLTPRQEQCLRVVRSLEERLGRSPSTREVSEAMGLGPSGSRFHLKQLVRYGLVTPPEVRLVLSVTPAGLAWLKRGR